MKTLTIPRRAWTLVSILSSFGLAACLHGGSPTEGADLYLLMGQSNMSGRGLLDELPSRYRTMDAAISVYGNDGVWRVASEPLDVATNQIDTVSADMAAGVGPGLVFARTMSGSRPGRRIGLVPCAKGGSSITQWARSASRETLYGSCLARAREAQARGRIAGILWYQGESDADTQADADAWPGRFSNMMDTFRRDLGEPGLPLVVVGLGDRPLTGPYAQRFAAWATVQTGQFSLRMESQAYVSAAGLPRNADKLHLSTDGQIILGHRLAVAMITAERDR